MSLERSAKSVTRCLRCTRYDRLPLSTSTRTFTTTTPSRLETEQQPPSSTSPPPSSPPPKPRDPLTVASAHAERQLLTQTRQVPIGSRRRRAAIASTTQIPFSQLPYQCFQEARAFLQEDRNEKLERIRMQRERVERLSDKVVVGDREVWQKENRLRSMRRMLEGTKVLADVNDPLVKKRFEDGQGDMNKPIYRYLADKQWRAYKRVLLMQRITQMTVVPDVLPAIDPILSTELTFPASNSNRHTKIHHGDIVDSLLSEQAPTLYIQPYDQGTRLVTIAVVNPDVPSVEKDGFEHRCHFLAVNIPITPTDTRIQLGNLDASSQIILPWLAPYSQKGLPYQRLSIFILQQPTTSPFASTSASTLTSKPLTSDSTSLDTATILSDPRYSTRAGFNLRSFVDKHELKPVGVDLFRTKWDDNTAGVMQRAGISGWDVEFRRKRVEPLPYKRKGGERYR